jgi:hypothetical protein
MDQRIPAASSQKIIATMTELARCSKQHRIIVSGSKSLFHMFELHRRGFNRVVTAATCCLPRGRYDVGFVDWRLQQIKALECQLDWLVPLLAPASVLVIWLDANERTDHRKLGSMLAKAGFRVEAGTVCEHGHAVSARRRYASVLPPPVGNQSRSAKASIGFVRSL